MAESDPDPLRRRQRRVYDSDDDDDFFAAPAPPVEPEPEPEAPKCFPGDTVAALLEDIRKKLQEQLLAGMFKYAEEKYGRRKKGAGEEESTKEDYALYVNSLRVKAKQADSKLAIVLRQAKELQVKVDAAQKDADAKNGTLTEAETERAAADAEGRQPILPASFIIPKKSKTAGQATLGSLVMRASKKDWGAALNDFAASRKATGAKQPEWAVKRNKAASILGAGKKGEAAPAT